MPTIVTIPNLGDVEFDDSLSEQQITDAINTRILKRQPALQATETITAQQAPASHGASASWDSPSAFPDQLTNLGASAMAGLTRGIGQVATAATRIPDALIPSAKITTPEVRERFALAPATKQYWDEIANSYENIKKATKGNEFASQVAEMVGGLGAPVLASAIPGGTIAAFAAQGYEGSRDQAEKYLRENAPGLSDEQISDASHKVGLLAGAVTGALTKYTHLIPGLNKLSGEGIDKWITEAATKQLIGIPAKQALANVAKAGVGAALQQAAFSAGEMAVAKPTYEPNLTLAEAGQRLVQSAAAGGIVGAGLRGFTEARRRVALGGGAEGVAAPQNEPSIAGGTEVGVVEPAAPSAPPESPAIPPTPVLDPASLVGRVFQYAPGKIARIVRADDIGFSITSPDGIRSSTYHEINSHPQDVFDRTQALPEMPKPAAEAAQPEVPSAIELQRQQGGIPPERAGGIQGGQTTEAGASNRLLSPAERQTEAARAAAETPIAPSETIGGIPETKLLPSETKPAERPTPQPKLETPVAKPTPERPANVPKTSSVSTTEPLAKRGGAKGKAEAGKTKPITERGLSKAITEAFARPWDLIDELEANLGGKLSLPIARQWLGPDFKPTGRLRKVFSNERTAYGPDVGAQAVSGMKSFENDETFLRALEDAAKARKGFRETRATERKATEQAATQREDFEKQVVRGVRGAERIPVHDLLEGDEFTVKGQKFTVDKLEIDPDGRLLSLTVKDGPRFGVQSISPDYAEFIHVDKKSYKPVGVSFLPPESNAPVEAPVAQPPATPPEGFTLSAPESVEQQKARLAAEQAKQAEQRAKEELARKAAAPLTGTTGDLGQGDLLNAPEDLFAPPTPKARGAGPNEPMTLKEDVQMELANITSQVQKGEPVTYGKEPEQPRTVQPSAPQPVAGARQATVQARPLTVEQSAKIADAIRQRVENLQTEQENLVRQAEQWGESSVTGRGLRAQVAYLDGKIDALRDAFEHFVDRPSVIARLEAKKIKPGGKQLSTLLPGLDPETARSVWNTGLDIAIQAIKAGRAVREAIDKAVEHIRAALKGAKFDENAVRLELARDTSEALMDRREATPPPLPPTAAPETKPPISQKQGVSSEEPTIAPNAAEKVVLDSRPFKDTAQLADELGIITPKEDESGVPTKVGDVYDQVLSRPGLNNAVREASVENASNALREAGLAVARHADGLFRLAEENASQEDSGQRLVSILEREIQEARADNRPERIANLLNSTVVHLARDKNKAFSQPLKNKLYALAQGERSTFGRALGSLAMWSKVLAYVAQNPDLHLNRLYSRFVGGEQIEPIIEKIEKVSRETVKPEDIKAAVDAAGAPSNAGEIVTKILKTPRFSAKSIQGEIASALVKELGMSPDEAAAMAGRIYKALEGTEQAPGTLRKARQTALEKVQAELGPEQKKVFKKGKTLWQKIERAVRAGLFDSGPILQDMAKANGWTVPSEAQKAQLKAWVEKENYLRTPTVRQINEANGDVVKATIAAEKGTETERLKLIKDIQANWSRWSMPISWNPKTWLNPQIARNNAKAINEFVGANLLFKLGFPVRQFVDVGAVSLPLNAANRSLVHVLERAERTGGFDAATLRDFASATQEMVTARIASVKAVYRAAERTATGHLDRKVLERMTHSIGIFERMRVKADELEKAGNTTAAHAVRLATLLQAGYRAAATFDSLQAVGLEWQEMRQQLSSDLRAAGKNRAEIATQLDDVFGGLRVDMSEAEAEVRAIKAERGLPIDEKSVQQDAWGLVKSRAYDRMRRATGASTDYQAENEQLRELHSWNLPETGGIGGVIAGTIKAIKTATEKVGVPTGGLFSFGNAMGIAANRMATFSGGGLFGGFGFGDSPWYLGERNIRQRRIEAVEGLAAIGTLIGLAAAGKILIQTRYPKDKDEKEKFIAEGHKLNSVRFINDDGRWLEYPIQMSPFSFIAGPLYMIGGIQQLLTEQKKAQDTLNAEAAKKGLVAGRAKALETGDVMGVLAQGLYGMLTGGRTASGAIQSFSDYGDFHLNRAVAGFASPYLPTVPAWQEISRMMGIAMDTRTATVLELMVPVPGTNHERVNSLGDTMSNPNALVRVLQVLSGGIGFGSPQDIRDNHAYRQIFNAGYSAPDIGRNKGFDFNGVLRPMTPTEFDTYVAARGRAFKQQLQGISTDGLPQEEAHKLVAKAFHEANSQALQQIGVTAEAPQAANVAVIGGGAESLHESPTSGGAGSSRIGGPVSGRLITGFGAGFGGIGAGTAAGGLGTVRALAMAEATGGGRIGAAAIAAKGIRRAGSRRGGRRLSIAHRGLGGKARSYRIRGLRRR